MTDSKNSITALLFTFLMLVSPLATAASVTTFSNGDSEILIEVRDESNFMNTVDGTITLPAGGTVTDASVKLSTGMATHQMQNTINSDTQLFVWDPAVNNQQTEYSNIDDFTYHEDSVGLVSGGYSTDFERNHGNFQDHTQPPVSAGMGWQHGSLTGGTILNDNCNTGMDCWGTNMYDSDNDYTNDDQGSGFSYSLISPAVSVEPASFVARFSSWHGMHWTETNPGANPTKTYWDCGYVMVRNSSSPSFPPPDQGWSYIPFDTQNSSGLSFANGLYPIGNGNGKIQTCDGLTGNDYAIGGESTSASQNPTGWATLAVNLNQHITKYVQLKFVLSYNAGSGTPYNSTMPGWFIDDFRVGDPLPQSGWMTVKGFTPRQAPMAGFPDGYGVLQIEQETSPTNSLKVEILRGSTTEIVVDKNGNQMTGLIGPIIELWDIDASEYPVIDLRFQYDTGQYRLSTAVLHGISLGTRVGSGLNDTSVVFDPFIIDGVWMSPGGSQPLMYAPTIVDQSFNPPMKRTRFSQPIVGITPVVVDDCLDEPDIQINLRDNNLVNLTVNTKYVPSIPAFGFSSIISYANPCGLSEIWFDLEFGHSASGVSIDIANDGDIEWAMDEPAFGAFGRQTTLWTGLVDGENQGGTQSTIVLNAAGKGIGGSFMIPRGATVINTDVVLSNNTISSLSDPSVGFDLSLMSSNQEEFLGSMDNVSMFSHEILETPLALVSAINSLLQNPLVATSHIDAYGNEWITLHFVVENTDALTSSSILVRDLDIIYEWETTLDASDYLDRELNQGIALGTGAEVSVPMALSAGSGGAVSLSDLSITTSAGYDSTLSLTGNPIGLYPNGDIIEAVSTHTVDSSTGTSFAEARLRMESSSGVVELSYSDLMGFAEAYDPDNLLSLESSSVSDVGASKHITWRFRINTAWEDTEELRLYASLVASNGVNGLPGAVVLAPPGGNAIENDAYVSSFELQNYGGVAQDLTSARSNQNIFLVGSVRLENLDISPDPTSYNLSLQRWDINNTGGNVTQEWVEVVNTTGSIGGDFNWEVDLGFTAAGEATYRFMVVDYTGGDTLCPASPIISDADCGIPFNLSIDTYAPTLVNISVLNAANLDPTIWSNWRPLVDDTWVLPTNQQKVRAVAQDIPSPPTSLDMYYWVEYDHDTDADGEADEDEYVVITLTSDGNSPTANYTGTYSDDANKGQDPAGKVSAYIVGADLAGNAINGGGPGFEDDLVTYVSMSAKSPTIRNFFIEDSNGERLHNPAEGAPRYQGPWNMSMYAGNEYHLIVEAKDDNGWRDIDWFMIDLGPEDMVLYYSPRNETAWADSNWVEIVEASNESEGSQVLRMDGGRLIDPFETEFYLDLPIRMQWDIVGITTTTYVPQLRIKDLDNSPVLMSEAGGRHKQRWVYSDGIQLDFRNGITPSFTDLQEPFTTDISGAFVYPGDIIAFEGQYAYVDGINNGVYINPEGNFTLEITRHAAMMDGEKGYFAWPEEITTHTITDGVFNINVTAPPNNNEYQYSFRLIDLPDGATDSTVVLCGGSTQFGCSGFTIKVDGIKPAVKDGTWTAKSGINGEVLGALLPSSTMHCVDVEALVKENAALIAGEVTMKWRFFSDADNNLTWPVYGQTFGVDSLSTDLSLARVGSDYLVSGDCIDLWPDPVNPSQSQITTVDVIMWIEGRDSAGWSITGGGPNDAGGVSPIWSSDATHNSAYRLVHEEARFEITAVRMTPSSPAVGQSAQLEVSMRNSGTKGGNITLDIQTVVDGGFPTSELLYTTDSIGIGEAPSVFINLEKFTQPTSGMYFIIVDADTNEVLWNGSENGKAFNVKVASEDPGLLDGMGMLIVVGLAALILILLVVVIVLVKRDGGDDTYEYEYEGDVEQKEYVEIPTATQSQPPSSSPAPAADVDPVMASAMAEFPQWDQEIIQGYFDQGWDLDSLRDWVNSNQ
jgi:hypothetical protein